MVLYLQPNRGYKANLISTIVDHFILLYCYIGYKANLISTIVDSVSRKDTGRKAIKPI